MIKNSSSAASGLKLERYYAQSVCSPSRATLMTGKYPTKLGLSVKCVLVLKFLTQGRAAYLIYAP